MQYGSQHGRFLYFGFLHFQVLTLVVENLHVSARLGLYSLSHLIFSYVHCCLILVYYYALTVILLDVLKSSLFSIFLNMIVLVQCLNLV